MDIKQVIEQVARHSASIQSGIEALRGRQMPSLRDFFSAKGLQELLQSLARALVAIRDEYCVQAGISEEQLIAAAAEWLDEKIDFRKVLGSAAGGVAELVDGTLFKFLLKSLMAAVDKAAARDAAPDQVAFNAAVRAIAAA